MAKSELIKSVDTGQVFSILILLILGLLSIYTATSDSEGELTQLYLKQLTFVLVGVVIFAGAILLPQRFSFVLSYLIYVAAIFLLTLVLIVNRGPEPARWFNFGTINFQPSEAAKLAMILALARLLDDKKKIAGKLSVTIRALIIIAIPMCLVVVEPDLGTAMVFPLIAIPMMIYGGVNLMHLMILAMPFLVLLASFSIFTLIAVILILFFVLVGLKVRLLLVIILSLINIGIGISGPKLWNNLHPYQQQRIKTFMNPEADPQGAGYQVIQSKIAVGSGGLTGKGYLQGSQGHLKFLPAGHTDFVFSVFCEELGFLGASVVILMFFLLSYRGLIVAGKCRNRFSQLVIVGASAHFGAHALINIGMAIGMMPVTGLPLPFMSYGGSSLILNLALAGIMVGLGMRWREY